MDGHDLRALREHARISQVELAARLGISQQAVSAIESRRTIRARTFERVLAAIHELRAEPGKAA